MYSWHLVHLVLDRFSKSFFSKTKLAYKKALFYIFRPTFPRGLIPFSVVSPVNEYLVYYKYYDICTEKVYLFEFHLVKILVKIRLIQLSPVEFT